MENVSVFCFLASYTVAFGCEVRRALRPGDLARRLMFVFGLAGLVAHTIYLFNRAAATDLPPLLSSTADWTLVLAWMAIAFFLLFEVTHRRLPLGLFVLPVVLVVTGTVYFTDALAETGSDPAQAAEAARGGWAMLHASFLATGSAGVLLAFVASLMYLVQHRRLKNASAPAIRLPSLERLSVWNWWAVIISVPLLTLGMVTGLILIGLSDQQTVSASDPLVIISSAAWAVLFALFLWLARREHPRGKHVAWLTIIACAALLTTLVGLQLATGSGRPHGNTTSEVRR